MNPLWLAGILLSGFCNSFVLAFFGNQPFPTSCSFRLKATIDDLSRGDAKGAALRLEDIAVSRGSAQILQGIDWRIEPKSKWALVGGNGCGKSTLLKAIMEELPYEGKITIGTTQEVGYLQQTAVAGSTKTVFEEAASAMAEVTKASLALEKAEERLAASTDPSEKDLEALDRAIEQYELVGGYQQEQEVSSMLKGLGFTNLTQRCDELSGGWQMRVSFARMLLSKPSLCLMDEPGNHLDRSARKWLARYLKNYNDGAMILVTHDVELLEAMDHIGEISVGALQTYKSCTYSQYLDLKDERSKAAQSEYERNLEKAKKLQDFVDKWGASATKATAAQSRVKQLEKMKQMGQLDAPTDSITQERFKPRLVLPKPPKTIGETLLSLQNAQVGYSEPLVSNINFDIQRGMKILIRGPNGAGKTTILDTLRGTLPLLQGARVENDSLRVGVFTQDLAQELDAKARAVDLVTAYAREGSFGDINISDKDARTVMGGLGLTGEKSLRKIQALSGGEKARVALAMFALKPVSDAILGVSCQFEKKQPSSCSVILCRRVIYTCWMRFLIVSLNIYIQYDVHRHSVIPQSHF
jgi:ATPase subunit of ABC transporter with duplicated ATPase domains